MVEFVIGKNIKTAQDKVLVAQKAAEIVAQLSDKEKFLGGAIKKQTVENGAKVYDLGEYQMAESGRKNLSQN